MEQIHSINGRTTKAKEMTEFHNTRMGTKFYEVTMPEIAKALSSLQKTLEKAVEPSKNSKNRQRQSDKELLDHIFKVVKSLSKSDQAKLFRLQGRYEALEEMYATFGKNSQHKLKLHIDKEVDKVIKEIESIKNSKK